MLTNSKRLTLCFYRAFLVFKITDICYATQILTTSEIKKDFMKNYLFLAYSLFAVSIPTSATDLDDFYAWTPRDLCKVDNFRCKSDQFQGRQLMQLLSGTKGRYQWIWERPVYTIYNIKTCNVKVIKTEYDTYKKFIGEEGYIKCAEEWHYKNNT